MIGRLTLAAVAAALLCLLPATAQDLGAPFATVTANDGASITLHLGRGPCVGDAMAAIWRPPAGDQRAPVLGCWVLSSGGETVLVSFLDGERGDIPARALVKARTMRELSGSLGGLFAGCRSHHSPFTWRRTTPRAQDQRRGS